MSFIHQRREKATSQDGELTGPLGTRFLLKFSTSTDSQQSKILKSASQEAELGWRKNFSSNPSTFPGRAHQYAFWIVLVKRFLVLPNSAVIMPMFKTAFNGYSVSASLSSYIRAVRVHATKTAYSDIITFHPNASQVEVTSGGVLSDHH
jgi:hypothetical protein